MEAYNKVLKEVCARMCCAGSTRPVHDYRFGTAQLSHWDWFHPSKAGQQQLAEMAYRRITASTS